PTWLPFPRRGRCAASRRIQGANSRIASTPSGAGSLPRCRQNAWSRARARRRDARHQIIDQSLERIEADDVATVRNEIRQRVDVVEVVVAVAVIDEIFDSADVQAHPLRDLLDFPHDLARWLELLDAHDGLLRLDGARVPGQRYPVGRLTGLRGSIVERLV